jgi:hypothetical protein
MPYPDERSVLTEVDVQHAGIGPFHQHSLPVSQSEQKKVNLGTCLVLNLSVKSKIEGVNNAGTGIDLRKTDTVPIIYKSN